MIVIGLDVHKQTVTAVAVDEGGRPVEEKLILVGSEELLEWASALDAERLWAVEDCRQLTGWLERQLLGVGEQLVRVPPKLTVPERRAGRTRGKSDPIDALAIARAALREPGLSRPRPDERVYREIKLLVDHRDDLVDQRRRTQQRLRWHLHHLDPTYVVPLGRLDRATQLERVARWLARRDQELQVRLARELVSAIRALNRAVAKLDEELGHRTAQVAPALLELPGCAGVTAAKLLAENRPDRSLQNRRTTRKARRRRTTRSELRPHATPPARPRRQPPTQRRALPDRNHPSPLPHARTRLPRAQTQRRQKPTRSTPLPQTTTCPRHLQHTQNKPRLDIGATLAQPTAFTLVRPLGSAMIGRRLSC
jgi:transposase